MSVFEKINDEVFLLKVPFGTLWTGVVLILDRKTGKKYLIDSSQEEVEKTVVPALRAMGIEPGSIDYLLNTHCHGDHIGGHFGFVRNYGVKVVTYRNGAEKLKTPAANPVRKRFPAYSPQPQSTLRGVDADVLVDEGELFDGRLRLIHTPGHDDECVAWYDLPTSTLITGDSVQANGTPAQGIGFYQDLDGYLASLDKLEALGAETLVAGHDYDGIGSVIKGRENVRAALAFCRSVVEKYGAFIKARWESGERDPARIAADMIEKIGCGKPPYLFMALYTVTEHLKKLESAR